MMRSELQCLGRFHLPRGTGTRVQMMPFRLDDITGTVMAPWAETIRNMVRHSPEQSGVGYLTIDEAYVPAGETRRRPGLHVDGGPFGGAPSPFAGPGGMLLAATHHEAMAWHQEFDGEPGPDGDCEHLRPQLKSMSRRELRGGYVYWLGPTCAHESLPQPMRRARTFVRVSMPSESHWFDGYTPSPFGVLPTGPVLPARTAQMAYRP